MKSHQASRTHLCAVGVIAKVFGVKGEVKIHSYARSLDEFEPLTSVLVGKSENKVVEKKIEKVSPRGNDIYIKFYDVDDRNASEALVGHFLFVEETARKRLAPGEFFVDDIIGMSVLDSRKKVLGVVKDVVRYPAQDVYIVKAGEDEVMVPAVRNIVRAVDAKNRTITIAPPEGLFDGLE
ncbi:MAG: ribosome maturation factor RimM [Bacteroidota bacterium]